MCLPQGIYFTFVFILATLLNFLQMEDAVVTHQINPVTVPANKHAPKELACAAKEVRIRSATDYLREKQTKKNSHPLPRW